MSELPPGWVATTLGTVAPLFGGSTPKGVLTAPSGTIPFYKVADMNASDGHLMAEARVTLTEEVAEALSLRICPAGTVIFPKVGGALHTNKKRVLARSAAFDTNTMAAVPTSAIDERFLYYWLSGINLSDYAYGSPVPQVSRSRLSDERLLLPPQSEQKRIVAAIEEQFSRLDTGVAALEQAGQKLKRMRASVLQCAVTDALGSTDQAMTPVANLLSVPLANGKSVPDGPDDGFPVLRLTAVRDGWIDVACSKKGAWTTDEAKPYVIRKGDYLVVRGNGSKHLVGRGAMVRVDSEVAYPDTLIRLRFDETAVVPGYAALIWNSGTVRNQIESAARTTAGIYKINQKDLGRIAFPVPSIEHQKRIHAWADRALHTIAILEHELTVQMLRTNAVRSSILMAAFFGRLVPQDPTDEPASAIVARISAESAASNGQRHTKPRKNRVPREKAII